MSDGRVGAIRGDRHAQEQVGMKRQCDHVLHCEVLRRDADNGSRPLSDVPSEFQHEPRCSEVCRCCDSNASIWRLRGAGCEFTLKADLLRQQTGRATWGTPRPMEEATPKRRSIRDDAFNLPNLLTMLRIVLIPGVLWLLWDGTPRANFWAAMLYIGTALTDLIDGYLARKWGQISVLGKFLDPLADKLLVMATLIFRSEEHTSELQSH